MRALRQGGRIAGWVLLLLAAAAVGYEAVAAMGSGAWRLKALGEIWFAIDVGSLNLMQAVIQRYLSPYLWEPVITSILLLPAWLAFGAPGALLAWACRRTRRRGRWRVRNLD
jgi:hypothetical protein